MTIQKQLFLLISALILIITATQVSLLFMFKQNVESEIRTRGKFVAEKLISVAVNELSQDGEFDTVFIKHLPDKNTLGPRLFFRIVQTEPTNEKFELVMPFHAEPGQEQLARWLESAPVEVRPILVDLYQELWNTQKEHKSVQANGFDIDARRTDTMPRHKIKQQLIKKLERFQKESEFELDKNINIQTDFPSKPPRPIKPSVRHKHSIVNRMFQYVTLVLILTSVFALLAVYWLSRRISRPLQRLNLGFKDLEQGQLGAQVTPSGVEETQYVIKQFNAMSLKLKQLTEAQKKQKEQQHLMEIGDVSKGIAHALRNPLHTIGLAVEQLKEQDLPQNTKDRLMSKVLSKIKQLDKSIQALLTVTNGDIERTQNVNFANIVRDVVLELKQSHAVTRPSLIVKLKLDNTICLTGNDNEIRSVIHTLVFNAYDACRDNNESIEIDIAANSSTTGVQLLVNDNGSGLDPKIKQDLFKPHVSTKAEGAGMGLYICNRILRLYYQGSLTLQNNSDPVGVTAIATFNNLNQDSGENL